MRILFCNKYNFPFSGTEVYLFELMELLREQGHEVALFSMQDPRGQSTPYDAHFVPKIDFKAGGSLLKRARLAGHAIYSWEVQCRLRAMMREFKPEIAHIRNIYHHLSPSILWELKRQGVPVLYHLNDFKLLCPAYNMVARGEPCEACKGGAFWHALNADCYPGTSARAVLAVEAYAHRKLGTYRKCVDLFVAPSEFVREKFIEHGWNPGKFEVLPHFQKAHEISSSANERTILYFGRLSAEKGVEDVLHAAYRLPQAHFVIAGDGPKHKDLMSLAKTLELENVEFVGHVNECERNSLISRSLFTVFPSHAYETLGKTILESFAEGRAVVASDGGSRRESIDHGQNGLLYTPGDVDQLTGAMRLLLERPELALQMGRAGWERVRQDYAPEAHYKKIIEFYERLISNKARPKSQLVISSDVPEWIQSLRKRPSRNDETTVASGKKKLRIAFIGGRGVVSKYSGIEAYYEEVGSRLARMGHEVTVYCRNYFTPGIDEHNGMRVVRLPTVHSKHLETLIHTFFSTVHAMTRPYDVVHFHALGPALFSGFPRLMGKKTAVTVQGLDWQRKKWGWLASRVLRAGESASVKFPDSTTVVSQALQRRFREMYGADVLYVPNGGALRSRMEPRQILQWGLDPGNYVLFLGRFSPEKGCHLLVEAFEQIDTTAKLVLAGASSYCDEYSRELQKHASDRIRMLDWVSGDTLDELLTNAALFVLPSDLEGLSLALLDAMGAGLCVLTSDVPENREVAEGAGFTFRRGDVEDLADRMRFLLANPAVRAASGQAARRRIEGQYQWEQIAADIEKAYFNILGWPIPAPSIAAKPLETHLGMPAAARRAG
jgi:glycosyltransferase involved in cell wall biosynthesis